LRVFQTILGLIDELERKTLSKLFELIYCKPKTFKAVKLEFSIQFCI